MRQEKQGLSCSAGTNKAGCSEQSRLQPSPQYSLRLLKQRSISYWAYFKVEITAIISTRGNEGVKGPGREGGEGGLVLNCLLGFLQKTKLVGWL